MRRAKVVAVIALVTGGVWFGVSSHRETGAQLAIVNELRPLIETCRAMGASNGMIVRNKALVWDIASNGRSAAHGKLPSSLQATASDRPITVFMVLGMRTVQVGTYSISKQPGYRQYLDICVAYWPEKKPGGMGSVVSQEPVSRRPVRQQPDYGEPNGPVAQWIAGLPRVGQ